MDEEKDENLGDMTGKELIETQPKGRIAQMIESIKDTFRRMTTPRLGTAEDNIRKGAKPLKVQTSNRSFGDMVSGNSIGKRISRFVNERLSRTIKEKAQKDIENSPTTVTTDGKVTHEGFLQNDVKETISPETILVPGEVKEAAPEVTLDTLSLEDISVDPNAKAHIEEVALEENEAGSTDTSGETTGTVEKDIVSKKDLQMAKEIEAAPLPDDSFFSSLEEIDNEINGKKEPESKEDKDGNTRD